MGAALRKRAHCTRWSGAPTGPSPRAGERGPGSAQVILIVTLPGL